ncbi:MAG: hypothetical protein O3B22_18100 [Proteobacteria bacterium]|nr:hypothetical protein [Pseudomonadota bacterium]
MERRLAAVLAADVVGYSRLMGLDETDTVMRIATWDDRLVEPVVAEHGGRIVKRMGDGFLIEFASAVAAVSCAADWQERMAAWREQEAHGEPLHIRIGVNLGEIVIRDDDIFGNGVNVAARLEASAEPDGICVSDDVRRQAAGRRDLVFEDLGERTFKNIAEPIRVWRLVLPGQHLPALAASVVLPTVPVRRPGGRLVAGGGALGALVVILALWLLWPRGEPEPAPATVDPVAEAERDAGQAGDSGAVPDEKPAARDPRLALAVLPFNDMSKDHALEMHADGMVEDLTTDLTQSSDFLVESRNAAFVFKGDAIDVVAVAKKLGVHYLIEGSLRPVGDKIRINVQFIEGAGGAHAWALRDDVALSEIDAFRNRIAMKVIAFMLAQAGKAKP